MIKKLLHYIKKYKVTTILCPLMVLLEVLADVLMPVLMARIVDL
jgi:ATP-binding cassette subfamily B multidrug efflux pump